MRTVSASLRAHLEQPVTTMCLCFKIVRDDGQEYHFTGHDRDLSIDGDTYRSDISFTASQAEQKAGLSVDNSEFTLPLTALGVTKADVLANLFYMAVLDVFWVNWEDVTMGKIYEGKGWMLGKATLKEFQAVFEVRSLANYLNAPLLDIITPECPYTFGLNDGIRSLCPASINNYRYSGTVSDIDSAGNPQLEFYGSDIPSVPLVDPDVLDVFAYGYVTWLTGNNAGYSMEVESYDSATKKVVLLFNMPYDVEVGDTFYIFQGCNKTFEICQGFGFQVDFGGEPNVPSQDVAMQYEIPE